MAKAEKEGNREKLLQGALTCLREKGYARTTARDLAAASGANLASIGYHFGSKEALLNEAMAEGFRAFTADIERSAVMEGSATGPARLERSLATMIDHFDEFRPFLVSFVEAFPQAIRSPELREGMAAAYEEGRAAGADMFVRAVEADGMTLSREHAETLSSLVTAVCDGLILQWLLDRDGLPSSAQITGALCAALGAVAR